MAQRASLSGKLFVLLSQNEICYKNGGWFGAHNLWSYSTVLEIFDSLIINIWFQY